MHVQPCPRLPDAEKRREKKRTSVTIAKNFPPSFLNDKIQKRA